MTSRGIEITEPFWQTAPEHPTLRPDEVQVWRADLDVDSSTLPQMFESLSPDEQARAGRFHFPRDRGRYVAARSTLRALLGGYLQSAPAVVRFSYGTHGKPALAPGSGGSDLHFNLAHSHGLGLFAFALGRQVGVDLERIDPACAAGRMAMRYFSPEEISALSALPESAGTEAFFNCWTRKEAYVKARGEGMHIRLNSFAVSVKPEPSGTQLTIQSDSPEAARWSLRALASLNGYAAAVAAEGSDWSLTLWDPPSSSRPPTPIICHEPFNRPPNKVSP